MGKIPVGATIAHAYRFAFGNFLQILAVMWLTWLLAMAAMIPMLLQMPGFLTGLAAQDPSAIAAALPVFFLSYAVIVVLMVIQFAGLYRRALGLPMPSPYFYFSLGKPVWRFLAALVLALLILFGVTLAVGIGLGILGAIAAITLGGDSKTASAIAVGVLTLFIYGTLIYGMVRLTFLLGPVVIAEERIGLKRAWRLGKGNFWRSIAVLLALTLPLALLECVWLYGPWGPGLPPMLPSQPTAEQLAAQQQATAEWMAQLIGQFMAYWYIILPLGLVFTALFYGGVVAAQAFAYRAVTAEEETGA